MKKMLTIGGAGFTGSSIVNYTIQNTKYNIAVVDVLNDHTFTQNLMPAIHAKNRCSLHIADVLDTEILRKIVRLEQPESFLYFAISEEDLIETELKKLESVMNVFVTSKVPKMIVFVKDKYNDSDKIIKIETYLRNCFDELYKRGKVLSLIESCKLFGPKQPIKESIVKIILENSEELSETELNTPYEFLYIKEFYQRFMSLYEGNLSFGMYDVSSGVETTLENIKNFFSLYKKNNGILSAIKCQYNPISLNENKAGLRIPISFGYPPLRLEEYLVHTYLWYHHSK